MSDLRLIGPLDHGAAWAEGRLVNGDLSDPGTPAPAGLVGAVAGARAGAAGRYRLLRDPLGLNKLFWCAAGETILVSARPRRLVEAGCAFEDIQAFPPGTVADLDLEAGSARVTSLALGDPPPEACPATSVAPSLAGQMRSRLRRFLAALATRYRGADVFVCLSGGLDSAGIAVLAREHFPNVTAVSFDVRRAGGHVSEDRRSAKRLAQHLGLPLLCVDPTEDQVLDTLDAVLVEGVDWRDFNVHCGVVNACLALGIAAASPGGVVLTGDFPNEFLVDYHAETYRGRVYYRLPRMPRAAQRAALVRGLETSNREVGPFQAWGLRVIQPYAAVADLFLALPPDFLEYPDRKERLYRLVFGRAIPEYVYRRPKTRAQLGDPQAGSSVLSILADRGLDDGWLRRRFAELHRVRDLAALERFIRGGRYRAATPLLQGAPA